MLKLIKKYKLIDDSSKYQRDTSSEIYQKLKEDLQKDFPKQYSNFIDGIAKQFQSNYKKFGKYKGYELIGGGISQVGSSFSVHDLAIVNLVLVPVLQEYVNTKGDEAWRWIRKNILQPDVSSKNPMFAKRSVIPILLDRLQSSDTVKESKSELKKLIKNRKGLPSASEEIFDQLRKIIDKVPNKKLLLGLIKEDIAPEFKCPSNVFVIILLFELMRRKNKEAEKIFFKFLENEKYLKSDNFFYQTSNHFHIIADNAELQEKIFTKLINSPEWIKENIDKFGGYFSLQSAFNLYVNAKAKETKGNLKFLKIFMGEKPEQFKLNLVFSSFPDIAKKYPIHSITFIKKELANIKKVEKYIKNPHTREEIVRISEILTEKKMQEETFWIIEKFINDSDPSIKNAPDDPKGMFNYHEKIKAKEDPNVITSVRGHVAWALQKLAVYKKYLPRVFKYTQKLLQQKPENLYVIKQAIVPLIEITARRRWLKENNPKLHDELYKILFGLLDKYTQYPAIAKYLLHAFSYYRELNEEEARKVLTNLENVEESAVLFIYFAIYRKNHFPEKGEFNSVPFERLLREKIKSGSAELRGQLSWHFWKLVHDKPAEFKTVKEYIDVFLSSTYESNVYDHLKMFIEDNVKEHYKECFKWFNNFLDKCIEHATEHNQDRDFNFWGHYAGIISIIAQKGSSPQFLEIINKVARLANIDRVFIDLEKIWQTHRLIAKTEQKRIVKEIEPLWQDLAKKRPKWPSLKNLPKQIREEIRKERVLEEKNKSKK